MHRDTQDAHIGPLRISAGLRCTVIHGTHELDTRTHAMHSDAGLLWHIFQCKRCKAWVYIPRNQADRLAVPLDAPLVQIQGVV